jgi:uncharacterized protein
MILMRLPWAVGSLCVALAMLLAGHTVSYGQTVVVDPRTGQFYQQRAPANPYGTRPASPYQRQVQPPQQAPRGGYYPGMLVQPAPQPQPGFSLRRLFGIPDAPRQAVIPQQAPRVRADRPRPPPAVAAARPEKPKIDPSTYVVVFGDALADLVGQGLDDGFSETPDVAVVRKVRSDTGLARSEVADWPRQIQEILNGGQKISLAVVMLGTNDRQPIKEGDASYDVLTDRWQDLYRQRVDAVARVFQERAIPLVWVGLPPMKNDQLSADLIAMNEIIRESVERLGGSYVDIWPGFVDEENRYTATGPDVNGQASRLRASDGVLFSRAGSRKAAHFADTEIKRILDAKRTGTAVAAVPPTSAGASAGEPPSVDQLINAALPALPELPGTPPLQPKPIVGPVLPLTRPDLAPGGTLVSGRPRIDTESAYVIQKSLREGVAPATRPGRADDFRWPRTP